MHHFEWNGWTINYNGDYSGDVEIVPDDRYSMPTIEVPFGLLRAFVADYVRRERIRALEDASDDAVLAIVQIEAS